MIKEIWKDIKDYEGRYQISNFGRVKSLKYHQTNKIKLLRLGINKDGYLQISLSKNGIFKNYYVARLVAAYFVINLDIKPLINHIDGNKKNNYFNNLEWVTVRENNLHAFKIGLCSHKREKHNNTHLKEKDILWIRNNSGKIMQKEMAKKLNVTPSNISSIIRKKSWI
jgi:predicted XRE-type DNA-binding protein